jgi:hypothetical protein
VPIVDASRYAVRVKINMVENLGGTVDSARTMKAVEVEKSMLYTVLTVQIVLA